MVYLIRCGAIIALAVLVIAPSASAFVIYDEAVQGDLPNTAAGVPVFVLVEGINEIKGAVGAPADPADEFQFILPADLVLQDVMVHAVPVAPDPLVEFFFSNLVGPVIIDDVTIFTSSEFGRTLGRDNNTGTDYTWGGHIPVLKGPNDPPSLADPPFPMRNVTAPVPVRLSLDIDPTYTLSFIVTPEPGSLLLLAMGGLAIIQRRK